MWIAYIILFIYYSNPIGKPILQMNLQRLTEDKQLAQGHKARMEKNWGLNQDVCCLSASLFPLNQTGKEEVVAKTFPRGLDRL